MGPPSPLRGMLLLGTREITKGEVWAQCLGAAKTVNAAVDRRVFSSMSPPREAPSGLWQVPLPTNTPRTATSD